MKNPKNENRTGRFIGLPLLSVLLPLMFLLFSANSYIEEMADFSGKWKLNEDQSEIAEGRYGPSITLIVTQTESSLIVDRTRIGREGQERKMQDEYNLNGEEKITENERGTTKTSSSSPRGERNYVLVYDKSN